MNWMQRALVVGVTSGFLASGMEVAIAGEGYPKPPPASAQLERMKKMVGRWEGPHEHAEGGLATVEYKLTAGGSAVVETMFPGTPSEMISVYHDEGGKLAMTHYCLLGNQPRLRMAKADDKGFQLDLAGGVQSKKEMHMHRLIMTWDDADHVTQNWTSYQNGKPQDPSEFKLTRVQNES